MTLAEREAEATLNCWSTCNCGSVVHSHVTPDLFHNAYAIGKEGLEEEAEMEGRSSSWIFPKE